MRQWRRWLGKLVPRGLKVRIVSAGYGIRPSRVPIPFRFVTRPDGRWAVFDDGAGFRVTDTDPEHLYAVPQVGEAVEELAAFVVAARSSRLLFDVGGHTGAFALTFCAQGPDRRAVLYEPSPRLAATAEELARANGFEGRLDIRPVAVGGETGECPATLAPSGFVHLGGPPDAPGTFPVRVVTLDEEWRRLGTAPDLVKIDVEGYEYEVLAGGRDVLGSARPVVFLELHLDILERRGILVSRVCGLLTRHGYRFFDLLGAPLSARRLGWSYRSLVRVIARPEAVPLPGAR